MAKINKGAIETVKTVVIAILITAIAAFVGGMKYQAREYANTQAQVQAAQAAVASKN